MENVQDLAPEILLNDDTNGASLFVNGVQNRRKTHVAASDSPNAQCQNFTQLVKKYSVLRPSGRAWATPAHGNKSRAQGSPKYE
jgi:hypothetical protein